MAIKYFDSYLHHTNDKIQKGRGRIYIGIGYVQLEEFKFAVSYFIDSYELFEVSNKPQDDYFLSRLGGLICCNEVDDPTYKSRLEYFFQYKDEFKKGIEFCNEHFTYLSYFISRLEKSFNEYWDNIVNHNDKK